MSWRSYQILTVQPDFTAAPSHGLGEGGATFVEFGMATGFGAWHGDTALSFAFDYRFDDPAQQRTLRNFFNEMGGRATPFFCPSWSPDFDLAEPGTIGATTIRVGAAGFSAITENRPDTEGRQIFLVATDGSFQAVGVIGAEDLGGGVERLILDAPLAYTFQPAQTIVGRLNLVRFAEDRAEYQQERPGHGTVKLAMVTSRQTRRVNENPAVEGDAVHNLEAFEDVIATDEDPILTTFRTPTAVGPVSYGGSQAINYFSEWGGVLSGTTFTITKGATVIDSTLYDSAFTSDHITFGFDAGSREAVAWALPDGTIRLGWKDAGLDTWTDFPGLCPVMFQTWTIDGTVTAGDADLIVFYLRPGFSGIFCRFLREDWATERLVCRSPLFPIYLQQARRFDGRLEIVGMDAGHRLARWRTEGYQTPLPFETVGVTLMTMTGSYMPLVIPGFEEEESVVRLSSASGDYRSQTVARTSPMERGRVSLSTAVTGTFVYMVRPGTAPIQRAAVSLATTPGGTYYLAAKPGTAEIQRAAVSLQSVTGTYA